MTKWILVFLLLISFSQKTLAQVLYPESELLEYCRVLEIKNPRLNNRMNIFPSILHQWNTDSIVWDVWSNQTLFTKVKNRSIDILPIRMTNHFNSAYARGYNDGALWKGKGYTGSLQAGITGKFGALEFTLAPIIFYSQNKPFELADQQGDNIRFNYQFRNKRVDYVQRYGEDSFAEFNMGQSEARLVLRSFTIGVSTQNIIWGPAQQNPLILSNHASGIPHIDLGTYQPIETKVGRFEGKIYYGILKKSDYFDNGNEWNYRYWSGLSISYNPRFLPSLILGFNRSFYKKGQDFSPADLSVVIAKFDDTDGIPAINDEYDQMGSLTMRWLFKEAGFEAYLEFGKNDFGGKFWGTEPDHARAYTLGFSKYVNISPNSILQLNYEHTSLDRAKNYTYRGYNSWYTHNIVHSGYSIDGQMLGAGIGTGSTSDFFSAQFFYPFGRWKITLQRIRFDDDYFYTSVQDEYNHDHEWTLESRYSRFVGAYLLGFDMAVSQRQNQYFVKDNDKINVSIGLNATWIF